MAHVPTISITNPELESKDLSMTSPLSPWPPGSPTVFDVVKDMEALDRDDMYEEEPLQISEEPSQTEEQHQPSNAQVESREEKDAETNSDIPDLPISSVDPSSEKLLNVQEFYRNKTVLLTGATGFIGKALLWKLLSFQVERIFILLRCANQRRQGSPNDRLRDEILTNKAFVALRRSMGPTLFDKMIKEKICPIEGDLTQHGLGLSEADRKKVALNTNIIFHCAGTVDGNERLDHAVKTNVLGTMSLIEVANECMALSAFIHLSPLHVQINTVMEDRLIPIPGGDPEGTLAEILRCDMEDLPGLFEKYKGQYYPDVYMLSKSLAEHMLVREVEKKQGNGGHQFPIAILRLSPVGPSVCEPLVGWVDGVNGANGTLLLIGRGVRTIQADAGDVPADIVPVDFAMRMIIGCPTTLSPPKEGFILPIAEVPPSPIDSVASDKTSSIVSTRDSGMSSEVPSICRSSGASHASSQTSVRGESIGPQSPVFPYTYHITMTSLRCLPWRIAYEPIRQYWSRSTKTTLPSTQSYFGSSTLNGTPGLNRARSVMNSIRSAASSYMGNTATPSRSVDARTRKRSSQRLSRCIDRATKLSWTTKSLFRSVAVMDTNSARLRHALLSTELDPHALIPEDADSGFWMNYMMNASFGIHHFVCAEPDLRLPTPLAGWSCALQTVDDQGQDTGRLIDRPAQSTVFSPDQIARRTARMIAQVKDILRGSASQRTPKDDEEWLSDMDDSLDDWCQDPAVLSAEKDKRLVLGKWRKKVGSNDESVKIVVLNDRRVNQAIQQITKNAGVQKQTAVNEAMKILARMSERTQLAFVWFAGYFLKSLFDDMFENIRIREDSIRNIRAATLGKRVVYVPVMKSVLDPLLVWYVAIRYQLPVPAFACEEALSQLGPVSDIYRLAGAYYVKRDKQQRSPLNTAVMAAYTQVLLREHGALSLCLEKTRSRTGKYQEPYYDGLIDMLVESTLQSNQGRSSAVSRVASLESTPPASPDTPSSLNSPTMSIDSSAGLPRKSHRDVVIVPINITYESIPELPHLIDSVLDQQPQKKQQQQRHPASPPSTMRGVVRPSEAMDRRNRMLDGIEAQRKYGRVLFGIGPLVSVQEAAEKWYRSSNCSNMNAEDESMLVEKITNEIQCSQRKALIVAPVCLVAAVVLYGRATGGVCLGKLKDMVEWLRTELILRGYQVDWEEGEDIDTIVLYAFHLLDDAKNLIIEGKEINDDTNIRVNDHADNVMTLSYYANQIIDVFLLDAFFAVVYLSFTEDKVTEDEFMDRFRFLVQMLEREFVISWDDVDEQFNTILGAYERRKVIRRCTTNENQASQLRLAANMDSNPVRYEQLVFLASLLYPTIDAYWITSCSLSALEAVPMLPRSIIPLLAQWIATHLITGRRTIYREVLSTESSRTATSMFMTLGFLTETPAKEKLSPDAQILLHELGIPTTETLIELLGQNDDCGKTPVSPVDPEGMMKALMAQIQMNRANSNMADLCQQIDSYRLGANSQRETFQNKQVFQKCLKQIKGILHASTSFAKKRQISLPENEERLVQLVYALRTSSVPTFARSAQGRAGRRISEAYNLRQ